jgi:hypothetical protein
MSATNGFKSRKLDLLIYVLKTVNFNRIRYQNFLDIQPQPLRLIGLEFHYNTITITAESAFLLTDFYLFFIGGSEASVSILI